MGNRRNYYRVLRVQPDAPVEIIRRSYRTLLQRLRGHPDLGGDPWDAALLNEAWAVLRDPERRRTYDRELRRSHDLRALSLGRFRAATRVAKPGATRRRHLYRILEVQTDAPQAVIEASWRMLRVRPGADLAALDHAWGTLGDPERRRDYDLDLRGEGARGHAARRASGPTGPGGPTASAVGDDTPSHGTRCLFCGTVNPAALKWQQSRCTRCASPLRLVPSAGGAFGRRGARRIARVSRVQVYVEWPGEPLEAVVNDLSPIGASLEMHPAIGPVQIVKIVGEPFDAIARVAYQRSVAGGCTIGAHFLTVHFARPRGGFLHERA